MKKKTRNLKYLDLLHGPMKATMKEFSVSKSEVEDVMDYFFSDLRKTIEDPRLPTIKITNLGTFTTTIKKVSYYIRTAIRQYRKGTITKEKCNERVTRLWMIRRRLQEEKAGIHTYKKWKKLNIEDEVQRIQRQNAEKEAAKTEKKG